MGDLRRGDSVDGDGDGDGAVRTPGVGNESDESDDVLAPLPEYKDAGEAVFAFDGLLQAVGGAPALRLREDLREGCGGQTWPAGMVLARHMLRRWQARAVASEDSKKVDRIEDRDAAVSRHARILELGAGGGLVGLAVALARRQIEGRTDSATGPSSLRPPVYISDQVPMLALMEHNIALNGLTGDAKALVLNWGEPLPEEVRVLRPNVILAADCVYFEPAFPLLLATLQELLVLTDDAVVYFCFKKRRRADMQFLKRAQKAFCVTELPDVERTVFSRQGLFLYTFTRKESKSGTAAKGSKAGNEVQQDVR